MASAESAIHRFPLRQSVCRWPFGSIPYDDFCEMAKRVGLGAIDLVDQKDWGRVKRHGLAISTANSSPRGDFIARGLNNPANHALILGELESVVPAAAAEGIPNVIAMFGNRVDGIDDATGITNCATALAKVAPLAERHGVTIILEMLNSRVDHRNFQGDTTPFGVAVCEKVASPRVRLLYDIYHMQIMEGDVIRTIRKNAQWFAHYHTAGNPGRNELNAHQELQYGAIAEAIVATGFSGWLAHEFIPTGDVERGLIEARDTVR
ncbi:MAG TPA: TIM barrel protein [Gemmatimonadales bacterium]|nr:TIM barrel protein [Gemmatimonadales bacterium]